MNKCPYCGGELIKGYLAGNRTMLKWFDNEIPTFSKIFPFGGEEIGEDVMSRPRAKGEKCTKCRKIIIDY